MLFFHNLSNIFFSLVFQLVKQIQIDIYVCCWNVFI